MIAAIAALVAVGVVVATVAAERLGLIVRRPPRRPRYRSTYQPPR